MVLYYISNFPQFSFFPRIVGVLMLCKLFLAYVYFFVPSIAHYLDIYIGGIYFPTQIT